MKKYISLNALCLFLLPILILAICHQMHASHILGGVNTDNKGIKGIESTFDKKLKDPKFIKNGNLLSFRNLKFIHTCACSLS